MDERSASLRKLVVEGHLNGAERRVLGPVSRIEVAELVKSLLFHQGSFPMHDGTGGVYEGATLSLIPEGFEIKWQRPYAWDPFTVAEQKKQSFADLDAAIDTFIQSEWANGIDGIKLS